MPSLDVFNPIQAIRRLSDASKACVDVSVHQIIVRCPFCGDEWDIGKGIQFDVYIDHFAVQWDTHQPDFIVDGVPMQIVRKVTT
jgi:hypothetical protein